MKSFVFVLVLALSFHAYSRGSGSHGGDPESLEFTMMARYLWHKISNAQDYTFPHFDQEKFSKAVDETPVIGFSYPMTEEGQRLRREHFEINQKFELKCALNYQSPKKIELDRDCFKELSQEKKMMLVLHEYFGILKVEWDTSEVSSHLGVLLSHKIIEDNNSTNQRDLDSIKASFESIKKGNANFFPADTALYCSEISALNPTVRIDNEKLYLFRYSSGKHLNLAAHSLSKNIEYEIDFDNYRVIGKSPDGRWLDEFTSDETYYYSKQTYTNEDGKSFVVSYRKCSSLRSTLYEYTTRAYQVLFSFLTPALSDKEISKELVSLGRSLSIRDCLKARFSRDYYEREFDESSKISKEDPGMSIFNWRGKSCVTSMAKTTEVVEKVQTTESHEKVVQALYKFHQWVKTKNNQKVTDYYNWLVDKTQSVTSKTIQAMKAYYRSQGCQSYPDPVSFECEIQSFAHYMYQYYSPFMDNARDQLQDEVLKTGKEKLEATDFVEFN